MSYYSLKHSYYYVCGLCGLVLGPFNEPGLPTGWKVSNEITMCPGHVVEVTTLSTGLDQDKTSVTS